MIPKRESEAPPAPPKKRARVRRDEIVREATRLFAERGYEGASMADLADCVGLRKASLFHHFASKDVLYAAVLEGLVHQVGAAILEARASQGSFAERLDSLSDAITGVLGESPYAARLLVREAMDEGRVFRERLADGIDAVLNVALAFTRAGQAEGVFAQELDARQLVVTAVGIHFMPFLLGSVIVRFAGHSPFSEEFLAERRVAVRDQIRALMLARGKR